MFAAAKDDIGNWLHIPVAGDREDFWSTGGSEDSARLGRRGSIRHGAIYAGKRRFVQAAPLARGRFLSQAMDVRHIGLPTTSDRTDTQESTVAIAAHIPPVMRL
jgi:hypothetical protein